MSYTLNLLTTATECDAVLKYAVNDKRDLEYKKIQLTRSLEDFSENSADNEAQITALTNEVNTISGIIGSLPEGTYKTEQLKKLKRAEYSLFLAVSRKEKNGSPAQLERELELEQAEQQLVSVTDFMAQVTAHRDSL